MTEATGGRYILKISAICVAKHTVRQQSIIGRFAGAEINIQPPIIVEIAEARSHCQDRPVEMHLPADIGEGAIVIIAIEAWCLRLVREIEFKPTDILHGIGVVTCGKDVRPPIVVEVKEPGCKAFGLETNSGLLGDVGELPFLLG